MDKKHTDGLRGIFWLLLNVVMVFLLMFGIVGMGAIARSSNSVFPARTISVSGSGEVEVRPDLATLNFSVVSRGQDPAKIQAENTSKINRVNAFVRAQGVEDKDIKTSNYNLYPNYTYSPDSRERTVSGYELRQTITIRIRDIDNAGNIVGGLASEGVNEITSLVYTVEDPEEQRSMARKEAFDDAYAKARVMAEQNGVRIVKVLTFYENVDNGYPMPTYNMARMEGVGGGAAPNLEPGSEKVSASVNVTYEIR